LMSVLGLVNLAKTEDQNRDNFFGQYFRMMETSINKLDETLKEILDYSRNARKELTVERIDIHKIVADNLERMQYMPGAQDIRKEVIIDEQFPFYSDRYRLSFIVNNLISNAIKYYDPDKAEPFLQITVVTRKNKTILEFKDNGIGIDEKHLSRVFDMFFRATHKNDGAGLGLYIVKEAVEKLNGDIRIVSKLGQGTTFTIEIPSLEQSDSQTIPQTEFRPEVVSAH
jgi:signal transduction histidine kinase